MPTTEYEAARELRDLAERKGLSATAIAIHLRKNPLWVQRRFNGVTRLPIDDYNLIRAAIGEMKRVHQSVEEQEADTDSP